MEMIAIRDLDFKYPVGGFRLNIPDFSILKGEKVAAIGPSGSGKTTLLNLIAGIVIPLKGILNVNGTKVNELGDAQRRAFRISNIGFVFQDFELLDYLNVMDNILHPYRITAALKLTRAVKRRARELAEDMGIGNKLKRMSGDLSHGERQRTAICRALLSQPKLMLADEATGNLDPKNKVRILDLLSDAVARTGSTLLAVTHDYELLRRFDRVVDFQEFGGAHA